MCAQRLVHGPASDVRTDAETKSRCYHQAYVSLACLVALSAAAGRGHGGRGELDSGHDVAEGSAGPARPSGRSPIGPGHDLDGQVASPHDRGSLPQGSEVWAMTGDGRAHAFRAQAGDPVTVRRPNRRVKGPRPAGSPAIGVGQPPQDPRTALPSRWGRGAAMAAAGGSELGVRGWARRGGCG